MRLHSLFLAAVPALISSLSGCVSMPHGAGLESPSPHGDRYRQTVWLRPVEVADPDYPAADRDRTGRALTMSFRRYLEALEACHVAGILPAARAEGDHELALRFHRLRIERKPYPAYFPLAIATLTLYIWANGTMVVDRSDVAAELVVYDREGVEVARFESAVSSERHLGYYDTALYSGAESRTRVVSDLVSQYLAYLGATDSQPRGGKSDG